MNENLFEESVDKKLLFSFLDDGFHPFNLFVSDKTKCLLCLFARNGRKCIMILHINASYFILVQIPFFEQEANNIYLVNFILFSLTYI